MKIHNKKANSITLKKEGSIQSNLFRNESLTKRESCCALINIPRLRSFCILRVPIVRPRKTTKADMKANIGITVNVKLAPPITALALITNQRSPIGNWIILPSQ